MLHELVERLRAVLEVRKLNWKRLDNQWQRAQDADRYHPDEKKRYARWEKGDVGDTRARLQTIRDRAERLKGKAVV